ncbi:hypothetical protein RhiirA5_421828 [Rhizophagus irregularis]|uniref:Crinkler effector protein N-terminal domain-containing protein n=1 Tax=Rhizophagus irregularis TaxID=588596 RepID=A0A2N0PD84_9GLOM|nr:hypothetical protein RhiirA5_421828 [Rhizophagus irregularis]
MSITLFCLVKVETEPIRELKDAIKVKKAPEFDNFPADKLKLWKVEISDDHKLLATREIEDYWSEKSAKRHIHVLVEPPVITTSSSREQELLDELTSLRALQIHFSVVFAFYYFYVDLNYYLGLPYNPNSVRKMCCLKTLYALCSNYFSQTNRDSNQNMTTVVRFNNFTFTIPVPTSSQAYTLLYQYKKSKEFKNDPSFLLFYLVLKNLINNSNDPQLTQDIVYIASYAWRSAEVDFREAYELLMEDDNVKNALEN